MFKLNKQEVVASRGVITSNHPLASAAGLEMYGRDGNAFDAAIASFFALTVVEPMMVSIFGAGFFVIRSSGTEKVETIDNYAVAPLKATDNMYEMVKERKPGQNIFETVGRKNLAGPLSVATPGTLKAWEYINKKYGHLPLSKVIAPAIRLAREGYKSSPYMHYITDYCKEDIAKFPETAKTYLPNGKPISPGTFISLPRYADTLEKIVDHGSDALYGGELGEQAVEYLQAQGGILSLSDLKNYELKLRDPAKGIYRDIYEIYSMAPSSSGGTHIIQILNLLEYFDLSSYGFGSAEHLHILAEILKIVFSDRQKYMGDPEQVDVPLKGLLSKQYSKMRVKEIGKTAKKYHHGEPNSLRHESRNTTHISAMDDEGNMVAATQTLNGGYGSCVTVPSNGIVLNNCMALFDPRPGKSNSVAPGKRMLSSTAPTIILRKQQPFLCIGTPGGLQIFPSVAQAIVNIIDFKMSIQESVEAPRIWTMGIEKTPGEKLLIEDGFPEKVRNELRAKGHDVLTVYSVAGGMNGVLRDPEKGLLHGGACWRADGTPMGISGGRAAAKAMKPDPLY